MRLGSQESTPQSSQSRQKGAVQFQKDKSNLTSWVLLGSVGLSWSSIADDLQDQCHQARATCLLRSHLGARCHLPHWPYDQVQGRAATMKKIPDITEQALKKALGELERSIRDTKRESRATDDRVAGMDSQRAQLADEVASANDRSDWCHVSIVTKCSPPPCLYFNDAALMAHFDES